MKRTCLLLGAGLTGYAMLLAQEPRQAFQQAEALVAGRGGGGGGRGAAAGGMAVPRAEAGKPFSATATSHTVQTLSDGTRVSQVTTMLEYRDAEGRVRTETSENDSGRSEAVKQITIRDTVGGATYFLNPARKTAVKVSAVPVIVKNVLPAEGAGTGRGRGAGTGGGAPGGRGRGVATTVEGGPTPTRPPTEAMAATYQALVASTGKSNATTEDLGTLNVNGVPATGTRVTTIVPVGAIGNDREFRNVTERWFSPDLNLLIKSVTTDPRFGTTTYELTNISRTPPDPSLFRVPADYTIAP